VSAVLSRIESQPRAVEQLTRALEQDRVAHAYAFIGPAGSGREATALAFAAALVCRERGCGACRECRMVEARRHPDVHVIVPTPAERNPKGPKFVRIGHVREIERQASLRPVMAPRKVFVVTQADTMTEDAPQAFLKTLEEPPDRTVIILILERGRSVPATVLSRCHLVRFRPQPAEVPEERATARMLLTEARDHGMAAVFAKLDRARPDRAEAEAIVDAWWLWCRDLALVKAGAPAYLLTEPERAAELAAEAERWTLRDLEAAIGACREAREGLEVNVAPRLTLEVLLSRLARKVA
jgi:DNA polymerase-3 subunit delta'